MNSRQDFQKYPIVDDDADDIDFFCEADEEINADVRFYIAHNGEEALKLLRRKMDALPDFIFLDLNMSRMDGRACLAELKRDDRLKDNAVIIYTTSSHIRDREETSRLGAGHYLVKPTSFKNCVCPYRRP